MADFSLSDALGDDSPSKAKKIGKNNPTAAAGNPQAPANPGWPGAAPGAPTQPSAPGDFAGGSGPGAPGQFPYPSGHGAPGQYPGPPSAPALEPLGSSQGSTQGSTLGNTLGSFLGSTLGSFLGSTHLKELQDSYPEALFLTQLDHFLLAPELPLGLIQMCLTQEVSQEEATGCGGFPPAPGPFGPGPGPMGPYGGPAAPGGMLMVPYDLPLQSGIMPQLVITIEAEPVPGADRFQVDFFKGPEVVFHLNPRFHEQTVVRNSNLGGCWGPEERDAFFPFVPGRRFELKILVEEDSFKVAVDGNHLLEYEHRVGGLEEVNLLRVTGDIVLYSVAPNMI
ncbi:hypothetical protein VZT92_009094 [Zoarces viviparus]|uniref:Galectin n=1 Tax=Zoarces viviparus TaxID=48416 RepID=A0AAW1FHB3_ZOAVI